MTNRLNFTVTVKNFRATERAVKELCELYYGDVEYVYRSDAKMNIHGDFDVEVWASTKIA